MKKTTRTQVKLNIMKRSKLLKILFVCYVILIVIFVVIKFNGDLGSLIDRVSQTFRRRHAGDWNYSLHPFKSILSAYYSFDQSQGISRAVKLLIGNVIAFAPLGFFIPAIYKKKFISSMLICISSIVVIEITQFITGLGIADIDDLILNTIGCLVGYIVYLVLKRFSHNS